MVGSVVGVKAHQMVSHYRSIYSAQRLQNELMLARSIALAYEADILVEGEKEGTCFIVRKYSDCPEKYLEKFCSSTMHLYFQKGAFPEPFSATYYGNGYVSFTVN